MVASGLTIERRRQVSDVERGELVSATKPFGQFLLEQRNGGLHGELSDALRELVEAVAQHGKAGSLTLTVKVSPTKSFGQFEVVDEVKAKLPEPERGGSLFFADDRGNLSRTNPHQPELPLREVPRNDSDTAREVPA